MLYEVFKSFKAILDHFYGCSSRLDASLVPFDVMNISPISMEAENAWTMLVMDQLVFPAIYYHFNLLYMYIKRWKKTRSGPQRLFN